MSNYPQYLLTTPIAASGDKTIPPATAMEAGTGRLSQEGGWDEWTSKPIGEGGVPPKREDFNGALYLLSQMLIWYQQGGLMQYSASLDYEPNNEVFANGVKYRCIKANGPASTVIAPNSDGASEYWKTQDSGEVRWDGPQSLTTEQKAQARQNIDVPSTQEVYNQLMDAIKGFVAFDKQQNLTDEEKLQARTNIGAIQSSDISGFVRFDQAQGLNGTQQQQARDNIGVYSKAEVQQQVSTAVGGIAVSASRALSTGSTYTPGVNASQVTVVVYCNKFLALWESATRSYTVYVGGSSVGTITLTWQSRRTGGSGHGYSTAIMQAGYLNVSRTITPSTSIRVSSNDETDDSILSQFAFITVS